jgi:hypothetical protein
MSCACCRDFEGSIRRRRILVAVPTPDPGKVLDWASSPERRGTSEKFDERILEPGSKMPAGRGTYRVGLDTQYDSRDERTA